MPRLRARAEIGGFHDPDPYAIDPLSQEPLNDAEAADVEAVVRDHIHGWHTGDAQRMERSLHDDLVKRSISKDPSAPGELRRVTKTQVSPRHRWCSSRARAAATRPTQTARSCATPRRGHRVSTGRDRGIPGLPAPGQDERHLAHRPRPIPAEKLTSPASLRPGSPGRADHLHITRCSVPVPRRALPGH